MLLKESCFFFILVSFFVYESTYLIIPFIKGFDWSLIWKLQISMVKYHLTLTKTHTYGSEWWMWPLMKRPIWYYYHAGWVNGVNRVRGILCIGNPLIFWFMPLAVGFAVREFVNKRNDILMFVIVGFFTQWLQWAPVIRVKFFHYIYTAMPFAEIAFAILLERLWRKGSLGRGAVIGYLVLVTLMFFYWFPLYNGFPITKAFFRQHMWFRSWI